MKVKSEKLKEALRHAAAEFLEQESNRTSLITVSGVTLSKVGDHATILMTVFPESQEAAALDFANRRAKALRAFLSKRVLLRRLPSISFAVDRGEKTRQRIEMLSA